MEPLQSKGFRGVVTPSAPNAKTWDVVQRAFLQSIIWRDPTKVTDATKDYLNEIFRGRGGEKVVYDLLLTVATVPEHPFNAKLLHLHLTNLQMPERGLSICLTNMNNAVQLTA